MINNYVFTSVNAYTIGRSFVLSLSLFLGSCLDFGDDIELVGTEISGKEINYVSELTGLSFPHGTEPVGYYFLGSGIDRSLALKAAIPEAKREDFMRNDIFKNGGNSNSGYHFAQEQKWWKVDELTDGIDRVLELPGQKFVECTVGLENGKTHVYVTWFEI
jgi:hypothetical protein